MRWPVAAALIAALLVAGLLVWMAEPDGGRAGRPDRQGSAPAGRADDPAPPVRPAQEPERTARVTLAIEGPDGSPAGGAAVRLEGRVARDADRADARGRWSADALPPGEYRLLARDGTATGALAFAVDGDADLGTLRLIDGVLLAGRVLAVGGGPVDGARVELRPAPTDHADPPLVAAARAGEQPLPVVARARSGPDGAWELVAPPGGAARLVATHPDHGAGARTLPAVDGPRDGLDLHLDAGGALRGVVVDTADRAVAGARVTLACYRGARSREPLRIEAFSGDDGRFRVAAAESWRQMLTVRADGFASWRDTASFGFVGPVRVVLQAGATATVRVVEAGSGALPVPGAACVVQNAGGLAAAVTDADGVARLAALEGGADARLMIRADGFVPRRIALAVPAGGGDLGEVGLERGGTVRGTVRTAGDGAPVAGATVRAFGGASRTLLRVLGPTAVSDGAGRFTLRGVPLAATLLVATHPDFVSPVEARALRESEREGGEPLFATGRDYVERDVELVPAVEVRGIVLAPDGGPAAGARVLADTTMPRVEVLLGLAGREAACDGAGRFVLGGRAPDERLRLAASHPAHAPSAPETVVAGTPGAVELRLRSATAVAGRAVDEAGAPLPGCRVQLSYAGTLEPPEPVRTGADGRFLVDRVPAGSATLSLREPTRRVVTRRVEIPAGRARLDVGDLVLVRAQGIAGVVVDADGRPVGGVTVLASFHRGNRARPGDEGEGRTFGQAVTDEAGRFSVEGLREGIYRLRASLGRRVGDRPLVATGTDDARLVLVRAEALRGAVTSGGEPVEGAFLRALLPAGDEAGRDSFLAAARTGADGRFSIEGLPGGLVFSVEVRHAGLLDRRLEEVSTDDTPLAVALEPGARVGGVVVGPDDGPLEGARIGLRVDGETAGWERTDAEGRFRFGGLPAGRLEVQMQGSPAGHLRGAWREVAPGRLDLRVVAEPGARITGRVVDGADRPVTGLRVTAVDAQGRPASSVWVWDASARFELAGLRAGTYVVQAHRGSGKAGDPPVAVVAGVEAGSEDITIRVE